jgi:hypothetical protein
VILLIFAHQCTQFTTARGCYLKATHNQWTILKPCKGKDIEVYANTDFSGNWDSTESNHIDTACLRCGSIIMYVGCPVTWKLQLQREITLSSIESEYTGRLSYVPRDAIQTMELPKEMKKQLGFPVQLTMPKVHCKVFKGNSGTLEIATTHKYRPRMKHLNVKLHHFWDYVTRREISIHSIGTSNQLADYLTQPVNQPILERF